MITTAPNKSFIKVKGIGKRLWVYFDSDLSTDTIEEELEKTFTPMKQLARNAKIVVDVNGKRYSKEFIEKIDGLLKEKFSVAHVTTSYEVKDERRSQMQIAQRDNQFVRSDTLLLAGRVRSGQIITTKKHLIIMGDVNPGGELEAGGDIIVIGNLYGTAAAGQPNKQDAIILALNFRPLQVKIANILAAGLPSSKRRMPEFARVENDSIVVEDYLRANPFSRLTWPIMR